MSRTIRVGQGLLKVVSLSEAIERASAGDTIVVDPGVHIDDGFVIPSYLEVTIRGEDPNPRATVIQTRIGVEGNLILRNLTVKAQPYHNGLFIAGGGAVRAERCIFVREDSDQYPVVWAEGGQGFSPPVPLRRLGGILNAG